MWNVPFFLGGAGGHQIPKKFRHNDFLWSKFSCMTKLVKELFHLDAGDVFTYFPMNQNFRPFAMSNNIKFQLPTESVWLVRIRMPCELWSYTEASQSMACPIIK